MDNEADMDQPVTRRELREELAVTRRELRAELAEVEQRFKRDLKQELTHELTRHFSQELSQHANAIMEHQRALIGALDDKFSAVAARTTALEVAVADLSPRVAVLERRVVSPPKRGSTKRR